MSTVAYPYKILSSDRIDLRVDEVRRDSLAVALGNDAKASRNVWLLEADEKQSVWRALSTRVSVRTHPRVLAMPGESAPQVSVYCVGRCKATEVRQSVALEQSSQDASLWTGELSWDRRFSHGIASIEAIVTKAIRSDDGDGVEPLFLGRSRSWLIHFDGLEPFSASGPIDVQWADFTAEKPKIPELRDYPKERFYVHLDDEKPVVYVNKAVEYLHSLLTSHASRGPQRQLQQVVSVEIATKVRVAMVNAAASRIELDEAGEPTLPASPWQSRILEELMEALPERVSNSGLGIFIAARHDAEVAARLEQDIVAAVEKLLHAGAVTSRAAGDAAGSAS